MKQSAVVIGNKYEAKVSGRLVSVLVLGEASTLGRPRWRVRNLATGREINVTAARLRLIVTAANARHCGVDLTVPPVAHSPECGYLSCRTRMLDPGCPRCAAKIETTLWPGKLSDANALRDRRTP